MAENFLSLELGRVAFHPLLDLPAFSLSSLGLAASLREQASARGRNWDSCLCLCSAVAQVSSVTLSLLLWFVCDHSASI